MTILNKKRKDKIYKTIYRLNGMKAKLADIRDIKKVARSYHSYLREGDYLFSLKGKVSIFIKDKKAGTRLKRKQTEAQTGINKVINGLKKFSIPASEKKFHGELLMINRKRNVKIFNFTDNLLLTIIQDERDYLELKEIYNYFNKYYKTPLIRYDDKEKYFLESQLDFVPYKDWSLEDKDRAFDVFFRNLSRQIKDKERLEVDYTSTQAILDRLGSSLRDKSLVDRVKKLIPEKFYTDKWPTIRCHGDLTFNNILFCDGDFYFIDWEDSNECIFFYDFLNCIFVEALWRNDGSLLEKYKNGGYDGYLDELFKSMGMDYRPSYKKYYLALYIMERLVKFEIKGNSRAVDNYLRMHINALENFY